MGKHATWACILLLAAVQAAPAAEPLRDVIDRELAARWQQQQIAPAPPAEDAVFLRRIYLDLAGIIPTADEAAAFLDNASPDKRAQLIEQLLASPRYAQHQADVWDMVFFGRNPPGYDAAKREGFQHWLREAFAQNMPYDELARRMLKAEGNTAEQGAPMYLVQYIRRPEDAAMAVSQTFLGVQLQCARCHDHPYESWTQLDFYSMAAFFARLEMVKAGKAKVDNQELEKIYVAEMNSGDIKFTGPAKDAQPGKQGTPVPPKFLLAAVLDEPDFGDEFKNEKRPKENEPPLAPKFSRKDKLADWVTSAENPYFARAAVNRIWAQFMGRGLVHPVDNMSESNSASHPALLDALASDFVAHKFDVQWLIREIVNSHAYQLAATGDVSDAMPLSFERARTRPLSAEELLESWRVATRYDRLAEQQNKKEAQGRFSGVSFDYVRRFFGEPNNGVGDFQGGLHEHLYLNNGELGRLTTPEKGGLCDELMTSADEWPAKVERLYLSILSRRPSAEEQARFVEYITSEKESRNQTERLREAMWVLMTCSEFRFNH
jgi:hypothetical protein